MTRLLSIALLAATLSAQSSSFVDRHVDPPSMVGTERWRGPSPLVISAPATSFDGNGALEAFYKPQHSHRKAWITLGILIGSGVATGILASRSASPPIGRAAAFTPDVMPTFSVSRVGIGGPGIPVTVVKGGAN